MSDPPLTDTEADAILRALFEAGSLLPPQGWATVRWEKDGSVSALLKVGCNAWRLRGASPPAVPAP